MAASPNLVPWFETARYAAKCTQAAPAMARLLTMRPSVLELARKSPRIEKFTGSEAGTNGIEQAIQVQLISRYAGAPSDPAVPLVAAVFPEAALATPDAVEPLDRLDPGDELGVLVADVALDP
jgi:hypothetical protein